MKYVLKPAKAAELEDIFALYARRVSWMGEVGIHQWNDTDYMEVYPLSYYREHQEKGRLYVYKDEANCIAGAAALLEQDGRWDDAEDVPAYYLHHLATDVGAERGIGKDILALCESIAAEQGKRYMRLDCAVDNDFLKNYYGEKGYTPAGICVDGAYTGLRLEKKLAMPKWREKLLASDALKTIFSRSSYRGAFLDTPVPREDLELIMRAGIAAPTACNRQTPAFVAIDDPEKVAEVKRIFPNPSCKSAPAFVMVFSQEIVSFDGFYYHVEDFSAAIENMLLAIKALGYESCWYQGNVRGCAPELKALAGMPERFTLVCLLPVGIAAADAPLLRRKRPFEQRAWFNGYEE